MSTKAAEAARRYYDTADVDAFYTAVWGGEDIHMGIYAHPHEAVAVASRRTVDQLAAAVVDRLGPGRMVLDLGAGYGGPARYLANRFGCRVVALNISAVQNRRHRTINTTRGINGIIDIVTGSFDDLPFAAGQFDVVWSQDALSHSDDQAKVLGEALRVLAPEGRLVFTDLMAADASTATELRTAVARTSAEPLPTPDFYRERLAGLGFTHIGFTDLSEHLLTHYLRIIEETRAQGLVNTISPSYLAGLLDNLPLWVNAARDGQLRWGIFHCVPPSVPPDPLSHRAG